jgi:hypothetical protein
MKHRIFMALLFVLAAFSAMADVRHTAIPVSLRGTWAADRQECNKTEAKEAKVVLSEHGYAGPKGHCAVRWVIESAGRGGTIYSARVQCSGTPGSQQPAESDVILMPGNANQLSIGDDFNDMKVYQRCP